ncbi:hypothetical protein [Vacuolonema iberomarrocanum]
MTVALKLKGLGLNRRVLSAAIATGCHPLPSFHINLIPAGLT